MDKHTIARSGATPVEFVGKQVAEARSFSPDDLDRGHLITVYLTDDGRMLAHIAYMSKWKSEAQGDNALWAADAKGLARLLLDHDPTRFVIGHPPGSQFEARQKRLLDSIRLQYQSLVGSLLANIPGAGDPPK